MRILLDTNIFIPLEDSSIPLSKQIAELNRIVSGKHELLIHPDTKRDINRDKDQNRKQKFIERIKKYNSLKTPPFLDNETEKELFGKPKKDNDSVDHQILYALHKNSVHLLITEDQGIHKKANLLGDNERVLTVSQAIDALNQQNPEDNKLFPRIQNVPCHSINLSNVFFDSLRDGYPEFDDWFNEKCAREGRDAWICQEESEIHAICIYKPETDPIVNNENLALSGKILKLCTFKVAKTGNKIGELLLKQAFSYAIDNEFEYMYLTVHKEKHAMLETLLLDYGFSSYGVNQNNRDTVLVKYFPKTPPLTDEEPLEYAIKYYPCINALKSDFYLVPIQPQYHRVLFPEIECQPDLFVSNNESAGNSIKQAYLCKTPTKSIKPGDILFFYRTGDEKAITTYGIVDQFHIESDPEKIMQWVSKRTVFSYNKIEELATSEVKVILFRFIGHLEEKITFSKLKQTEIVNGSIQSITQLKKDKIGLIIHEAKIENRTLFN